MMFAAAPDDVCMTMKLPSNSAICHVSANTYPQLASPGVVTVSAGHQYCVHRWRGGCGGGGQGGQGAPPAPYDTQGHHAAQPPIAMDPVIGDYSFLLYYKP